MNVRELVEGLRTLDTMVTREAADRIEALESEWVRLAESLRHAGVEPWHDGRSLLDGKRPREQHIAMIVAAERALREKAEALLKVGGAVATDATNRAEKAEGMVLALREALSSRPPTKETAE